MFDFGLQVLRVLLDRLREEFSKTTNMFPPTLYDQFGREVQYSSVVPKIGDTITIRRPQRFVDTAQ